MSKPSKAQKTATKQRRLFIKNKLNDEGQVKEIEILEHWKNTPRKTILHDLEHLKNAHDMSISKTKEDADRHGLWMNDAINTGHNRSLRYQKAHSGKLAIAEGAASFILGFKRFAFSPFYRSGAEEEETKIFGKDREITVFEHLKKQLQTQICLWDGLTADTRPRNRNHVMEKWDRFWKEGARRLFVDAGTTMEILSNNYLQFFDFPARGLGETTKYSDERPVDKLEVITNDRIIFHCLGHPDVQTKAIIVGGRQQDKSASISGLMAERFLQVNDIRADLLLLSVSSIRMNDYMDTSYFCVDSDHSAALKLELLRRSDIRIVLADSTKFRFKGGRGDTKLCPISKQEVDMVITDAATEEVCKFFAEAEVPLLVVPKVDC